MQHHLAAASGSILSISSSKGRMFMCVHVSVVVSVAVGMLV